MKDDDDHFRRHARQHERDFPAPGSVPVRPPPVDKVLSATRWLKKLLASGPMYQFEVAKQAEACGISPSILNAAKKSAAVVSVNFNDQNDLAEYKVWFWKLPKKPRTLFDYDADDGTPWDDN